MNQAMLRIGHERSKIMSGSRSVVSCGSWSGGRGVSWIRSEWWSKSRAGGWSYGWSWSRHNGGCYDV